MRLRLRRDTAKGVLSSMPPQERKRVRTALARLAEDPTGRTTGLDVKRLQTTGEPSVFRLRVGGWRAVFVVRESDVGVVRIFHRSEGYGWLDRKYP